MSPRPIGILGSDGFAAIVAERLAASGERVLHFSAGPGHRSMHAKNIEAASTLADIGFECMTVLSFIDDSSAFRNAMIGTPERMGLGAELNPGAVVVDFGARPPRETQALLGVTGMRGVAIVDAAIAGGDTPLLGATNSVFVGGYPDAVDSVEDVLARLGKVERTGPLGSAHTAAALMGYLEAAHHIANAEAVSVGSALGLSRETLSRVAEAGAASVAADNLVRLTRRTGLALRLAADRGVSADVIDFTGARLALHSESQG